MHLYLDTMNSVNIDNTDIIIVKVDLHFSFYGDYFEVKLF